MNWGISSGLKAAFPNVVPAERPIVLLPQTIDPNWLAGFTSAEGCVKVDIGKSPTNSTGHQVQLVYVLTKHVRDKPIMEQIKDYLGCGNLTKNRDSYLLRVTKISDIQNKIIPFFKKHKIEGVKALDFDEWCEAAQLMIDKKHLTKEGLELIIKIKAGMNRGKKL